MEHISPVHNAGMQRSAACCGNRPTIRPSARGTLPGVRMEKGRSVERNRDRKMWKKVGFKESKGQKGEKLKGE